MTGRASKFLAGVGALLVAGVMPAEAQSTFNGSTYQVVAAAGITWAAAKAAVPTPPNQQCHLATITSQAEDEFVEALRQSTTPSEVWIGGSQQADGTEPGGGWVWENGEGTIPGTNPPPGPGYANWLAGEPNNLGGNEEHLALGLGNEAGWNDEANTSNIGGYVVECDGVVPQTDAVVFNDPDEPVISVVEEIVAPGRIEQFSCVIKEPANRGPLQLLDLIQSARNTPGCAVLVSKLPVGASAYLRTYQRAFVNADNTVDTNKKDIVLSLIKSTALDGTPADLTRGVVISEENPELLGVDWPKCRLASDYSRFVDAAVAPTTVRVNMSGEEGALATNATFFCNAPKSGVRYSDQLLAYPVRNRVPAVAEGLLQLEAEAVGFRQAVRSVRGVCTDSTFRGFLDQLLHDFDAGIRDVRSQVATSTRTGVGLLEDVTRAALSKDYETACPAAFDVDAEGQFVSRLLGITYQAFRYVLYPNAGDLAYVVPQDIQDDLPPFPGGLTDVVP